MASYACKKYLKLAHLNQSEVTNSFRKIENMQLSLPILIRTIFFNFSKKIGKKIKMAKLAISFLVVILIYKLFASIPSNGAKNLLPNF